ncbi:unnamed protein product [Ectocarpus sp. CCAP 1310/34]|nr:unnamed protein product [Ectocarpus sp. CCAP 1310/34]
MEVIGLATATLVSKYRKMATFDEFLARFFVIGKAAVAVLLFFVGIPHMVWYLILWTEVSTLNPGEFQSMVRSSSAQAPGDRVAWLVMFHADWCSSSRNLQPMFGALARRCVRCGFRFMIFWFRCTIAMSGLDEGIAFKDFLFLGTDLCCATNIVIKRLRAYFLRKCAAM